MPDIIKMIVTNVLTALYQPFGFSIILAILFMFFYLFTTEHGWKAAWRKWIDAFKSKSEFRRVFLLAFYTALILFRTLLNRDLWRDFLNFPYFTGFPAPLNSEMICIFPYFCPYAESAREIREVFI